jgi:hypothetical protein
MGKRRADAGSRRFFDEFQSVRVSRFRADGTIDPTKRQALIPFPDGSTKLIGTAHTKLKWGGGWSYFICPKCARLAQTLYLIGERPLCTKCCDAMNIRHASRYGFGRASRRQAADQKLDQLIAKVETNKPLRLKPAPAAWRGRRRQLNDSQRLANSMRRRIITLRLNQIASQHTKDNGGLNVTRAYKPRKDAEAFPELAQVWRARTYEKLEQALDKAQIAILAALNGNDPQQRLNAAKIMLRTKQARQRGL